MALDLGYRLRALATENLNLKLLSLASALVIYSVVHGSQDAQRSLLLSVVALTPPETANRELVTPIPAQIRVTVRGQRSTLDDLHADDVGSVQIATCAAATRTRLTFEPSTIPVPPGLTVGNEIDPPDHRPHLGRSHRAGCPRRNRDRGDAGRGVRGERCSLRGPCLGADPWSQERSHGASARARRRVRRGGSDGRQVSTAARDRSAARARRLRRPRASPRPSRSVGRSSSGLSRAFPSPSPVARAPRLSRQKSTFAWRVRPKWSTPSGPNRSYLASK